MTEGNDNEETNKGMVFKHRQVNSLPPEAYNSNIFHELLKKLKTITAWKHISMVYSWQHVQNVRD